MIEPTVNVTSPIPCLVSINWYFEDRNNSVHDMSAIYYQQPAHANEHA